MRRLTLLLEQRALHLAIVHLSRRDDLSIEQPKDDYGVDLLVTVNQDGKITGRLFGVIVKASRSLSVRASGEENQFKIQTNLPRILEELPFPLALFVFNMADDKGYFRWLLAPIRTQERPAGLPLNQANTFTKILPSTIDNAIAQVNQWYEMRMHPVNGRFEAVRT